MPWKASSVMEEKLRFVFEYEQHEQTMRDVCQSFGISRETGYHLAATIPDARSDGTGGTGPGGAASSQSDVGGDRAADFGSAAGAYALGAAEAEADSGARPTGTALAGGEHHGRDAAAGRLGGAAPQAAANCAVYPASGARRGTQPGVVRGFQGLVSHRRRPARRSADHLRRPQPLSAALPGGG